MNNNFDFMKKQIEKIDNDDFELYCKLFGWQTICLIDEHPLHQILQSKCISSYFSSCHGKHIEQNSDTLYITADPSSLQNELDFAQFLYEMEVIADIPVFLKATVNQDDFCSFALRFSAICKKHHWTIYFSKRTNISAILEEQMPIFYLPEDSEPITQKIILLQNGNQERIDAFYNQYKDHCRIEKRRFIVLFRTYIMESISNYFKVLLKPQNVEFINVNWIWALNNFLYPSEVITSADIEKREQYSVSNIIEHFDDYTGFLKEIYHDHVTKAYIQNIMDIPKKLELSSGSVRHEDKMSPYLNVVSGQRLTTDQPESYDNTIYMLGGCVFFGYAIEDSETISSFLQRKLNKGIHSKTWRVVNYGTWGGNIDQTYKLLYDIPLKEGDIILVSYAGYMPLGDSYETYDISMGLAQCRFSENFYFNGIVHCNAKGYEVAAEKIFDSLKDKFDAPKSNKSPLFFIENTLQETDAYTLQVEEYMNQLAHCLPEFDPEIIYGGIVMNCNPFTFGHQYLIETASKQADHLFIFVVEENKSFFTFKDRYELVSLGTRHLPNVTVIPSGNLIISTKTFPGYFLKDTPDQVPIDTSLDLTIFSKYIAPRFHITKRFVGEEPFDLVTRRYNESMKSILPGYGIELIEIPRKETAGSAISASRVRKLLESKNFNEIKQLVPAATFEYLKNMSVTKED